MDSRYKDQFSHTRKSRQQLCKTGTLNMNYLAQFSCFKNAFLVCSFRLPSHKTNTLNKDFRLHLLQRSSFSFQCKKQRWLYPEELGAILRNGEFLNLENAHTS